jgi:hypothetical protein
LRRSRDTTDDLAAKGLGVKRSLVDDDQLGPVDFFGKPTGLGRARR